jgi:hypothetical protein
MPLNSGMETMNEHLRMIPIAQAEVHSRIGLLMRKTEPRSALAERCFAKAQKIFATDHNVSD